MRILLKHNPKLKIGKLAIQRQFKQLDKMKMGILLMNILMESL